MPLVVSNIKIKKTTLLFAFIYLLFNLLCFFHYQSMGTGALIITVLLIILGLLIPYPEMGVYLFSCLPFFNVMNLKLGTTSLFYFLSGIAILRFLYRGYGHDISKKILLLCLIMLVTLYNFEAAKEYIRWIIRVIPLILFFKEDIIQKRLKDIIDKFSLSMVFSSLWGLLMLNSGTSIYDRSYVYSEGTRVIRFAGLTGDSVIYGIQLLFLISFITVLIFRDPQRRKTRLAMVAILCYFGLLTYSRTFLFFLALHFLYVFFYWRPSHKRTVLGFVLKLILFISLLVITIFFVQYIFSSNNDWAAAMDVRLLSVDWSTGRFDVWRYYQNWILTNWTSIFRGMGFSEYLTQRTFLSIQGYSYFIARAHNLYIETLVVFGFLETMIIIGVLIVWAIAKYRKEKDTLYLLPLITLLITGMTTHGHFEYSFYLNLLLILSIAEHGHKIAVQNNTLEKLNTLEALG
jgi:hypothetical protein